MWPQTNRLVFVTPLCVCVLTVMLSISWQMEKQSLWLIFKCIFQPCASILFLLSCSSAESLEFLGQPSWLITQFPKSATSDVYSIKTSHSFFMNMDACHFLSLVSAAQRWTARKRHRKSAERHLLAKTFTTDTQTQKVHFSQLPGQNILVVNDSVYSGECLQWWVAIKIPLHLYQLNICHKSSIL